MIEPKEVMALMNSAGIHMERAIEAMKEPVRSLEEELPGTSAESMRKLIKAQEEVLKNLKTYMLSLIE